MRHNIFRRIERLEQLNGTRKQKFAIIVRGNSPEEHAAATIGLGASPDRLTEGRSFKVGLAI